MSISTAELMKKIRYSVDLGEFREENQEAFFSEEPNAYLERMLQEKEKKLPAVCTAAELDPSYCYRIFSGARVPSRNTLLRLAISMGMDVDEIQHALRLYGLARLDPRCFRDAAILFGISKHSTCVQIIELLSELGEANL